MSSYLIQSNLFDTEHTLYEETGEGLKFIGVYRLLASAKERKHALENKAFQGKQTTLTFLDMLASTNPKQAERMDSSAGKENRNEKIQHREEG